jgi:hypothetical protein
MKPSTEPDTRWWDGPAALLLLLTLLSASGRLVATNWTDHLLQTQTLVFLGALAGLALGQSRFRPGVALFFALAYGLFFVPWQLGADGDRRQVRVGAVLRLCCGADPADRALRPVAGLAGPNWAARQGRGGTRLFVPSPLMDTLLLGGWGPGAGLHP